MLEFGQTIKAKREQKGLTQKQLGQLLYVSDKTVSRWENNQIYPDITMLLDISKVLEIDYQELIEGSDYIEKKKAKQEQQLRRKKKGLFWFACLTFCLLLIFSYQFHDDERIEETGIDYIVSKKWNEIGRTDGIDFNIFSIRHYLSEYEKNEIIAYLDVDHWIRIDKLPQEAKVVDYQLGFYTPYSTGEYKSEHYMTYQNNDTYYFVLHENPSVIYQLPIKPNEFSEFFSTLPKNEFSYNHLFENKTSYIPLTGDDWIEPSGILEDNDGNIFSFHSITISTNNYFLLTSSKFDIQTVDIKDSVLYITGEKRLYSKPYVIGFKLEESININQVYVNNELKYDSENHLYNLDE